MRLIADTVAFSVNEIPKLEPDQRLQLSPAGGRRDAGPGDRLRDVDRDRRPRRGQGAAARSPTPTSRRSSGGSPSSSTPGVRFVEEHAKLRAMGRDLGADRPRALRRHRPEVPADALRRPGQLARADRGPAGEQRPADRARGARGDPGPQRPRPGDPASGLERGARPAAAVGPAVEPADPAGARVRDRPARVPRHLRGLEGDGRPRRRAGRGRATRR